MTSASAEGPRGRGEFQTHWRALLGGMIAASVGTIGLNAYTGGAFVPELVAKVGYTRDQLAMATLVLSGTVALVAPLIGQALDRWGPLRVVALAVIGEAIGFFMLGAAPAQFGWFCASMVVLGLLGAGTTPPGYARIIAARYDKHRGLALGLMIAGLGVVAISAPMVMTKVIAAVGWRGGYWTLSAAVIVLGGLGLLLISRDPAPAKIEPVRGAAPVTERGDWSALKRPLYWFILACFAGPSLCGGGFLLHMITIMRERGFSPVEAAQVQALVGVAIVVGRCTSGLAMDRFFAPHVAAVAFAISALGTAALLSTSGPVLCFAALAVGLTIGAELDILAYTLSRYFDVRSFGRLYSLAYSSMIFAGGASPVMIAKLTRGDDYSLAIIVCSIGLAVAAVAVALLPKFKAGQAPAR
jgi:MFS family permease